MLLGEQGLSRGEASHWRHIPPQLDCPAQRVAHGAADLWWPAGRPEVRPGAGSRRPGRRPGGARAARAQRRAARRDGGQLAGIDGFHRRGPPAPVLARGRRLRPGDRGPAGARRPGRRASQGGGLHPARRPGRVGARGPGHQGRRRRADRLQHRARQPGLPRPGRPDRHRAGQAHPARGLSGQRGRLGPVRPGQAGPGGWGDPARSRPAGRVAGQRAPRRQHRGRAPPSLGPGRPAGGQVLRRRDLHLAPGRLGRRPGRGPGSRAAARPPRRLGGKPRHRAGALDRLGVRPVRPGAAPGRGDPAGRSAQLRDRGRQAGGEALPAAAGRAAGRPDRDVPRRPPR